jgi:plasmid stabilization system protein ParE
MSYKLKFTDTANEDLRNIAFDIAFQAKDKEVAKNFIQKLRQECKILETFPNSGAMPKDRVLRSAGQRFLTHKGYLIFYTTDEVKEIVYILAVFNEKQDYMRIMKRFI